jgi:hypothetical protein
MLVNILFKTFVRYGQFEVAQGVGLYRKPSSLGRKSSARGRSIARSEKFSKIFFSSTAEAGKSLVGGTYTGHRLLLDDIA